MNLGVVHKTWTQRRFPLDSLTFPAGAECNASFADLEAKANGVVLDLMAERAVPAEGLSTLLSWFDKVRIGLWIGLMVLDNNPPDMRTPEPFSIHCRPD